MANDAQSTDPEPTAPEQPMVRPTWADVARARPFAVSSWVLLIASMAVAVIVGNISFALVLLIFAVFANVADKRIERAAAEQRAPTDS